jgi:hypothetical protein
MPSIGEVMHLAGFTGLEHDGDARAQALADQEVMQAGDGEQRRDRREVLGDAAVGKHENGAFLVLNHATGNVGDLLHGLGQALLAARGAEKDGQHADLEAGLVEAADLGELLVGEDGPLQLDAAAGQRIGVEQIALGTEAGLGGGDDLLANGINRRIGDLCEELLEIVVEQARLVGEDGEGRVVAHRADRLDAIAGHRGEDDALILKGVAERDLPVQQRVVVGRRHGGCGGQGLELDEMLVEPLAVGTIAGELLLDFGVGDDAALDGVDEEHVTGLQTALLADGFGRQVEHAGLGGHDTEVVVGDVVAAGTQAVAVQHGAHLATVGERDGGGTIPRLHEAGVVLVEGLAGVIHRLVVGPRFGNHHHHRMRERAPGEHEELEGVVEHR